LAIDNRLKEVFDLSWEKHEYEAKQSSG